MCSGAGEMPAASAFSVKWRQGHSRRQSLLAEVMRGRWSLHSFASRGCHMVPKLLGDLHQPRAAGESDGGLICQPVPLGVNRAVGTSYSPAFPYLFPKT